MRVTENSTYGVVRDSVRRSKERMEGLQGQNATLKKLNAPSDDPIGAAKLMEIRTEKVNNTQFQTNAKMAETYLSNAEQALGELADVLVRAKEIAITQASGASSNEDTRRGVTEEVEQLYQQALSVGNRRIGDRFIFGGYRTDKPPIDQNGKYHGDNGQIMVEVARDVFLGVNVPGSEAFNTSPSKSDVPIETLGQRGLASVDDQPGAIQPNNVSAFDEIQNLRVGLITGDSDTIRQTLERLDTAHSHVTSLRAKLGSRLSGLQNVAQAIERHNLVNAQLSSNIEDADMAHVVSELAKEETVFRSALASANKLIHPTLLDFLK